MDELVLLLLKKRAHAKPLPITTSELGRMLGMSQQNASLRLTAAENEGIVERGKKGISLTEKGLEQAHSLYSELKTAFEGAGASISGRVVSGLGEGRYYMSIPEYKAQVREKLGFEPYAGTLNIKLAPPEAVKKSSFLRNSEPIMIIGFKRGERTFGDLFAYPCRIGKSACALVVPLRTHHPSDIIELVAPVNLKKALGKKDGDEVKLEFE